jgi:hypothetical protein
MKQSRRILWCLAAKRSLLMAALLSMTIYNSVVAQNLAGPEIEATAQVGSGTAGMPATIVLENLPQATAQLRTRAGADDFSPSDPQTGLTKAQWKALKAQAAKFPDPNPSIDADGVSSLSPSPAPSPNPKNGDNDTPGAFRAFVAQDQDLFCAGGTPSDMGLAVGQSQVVQVVNRCISVYDKTTGLLLPNFPKVLAGPNGFLGGLASGQSVTDPRAMYDFVTDRFVVIAIVQDSPNNRGFLALAASGTGDATGTWNVYRFQVGVTGQCVDYPTLGQNWANDPFVGGIYVGFNIFQCGNFANFQGAQVFFLPKSPIYAGQGGFGFNIGFGFNVGGTLVDTVQPVNVSAWGQKPRTELAVNSFNLKFGGGNCRSGCNGLVIWSFANTLQQSGSPGPVASGVVVRTPRNYIFPADADQPGRDNSIDTAGTHISGTVQYMGGFLYPTLNTGNGGTSAVLGWQVQPFLNDNGDGHCTGTFANACPTLTGATIVKEFCYDCGAGHANGAYWGTIQPDPEGNWTMVFNFSNRSISPATAFASNRVTWPTPFHDSGIFLCQNQVSYNQLRWGDYTATAIDLLNTDGTPSRNPAFWFSGMFVKNNGNWSTCIGANTYSSVTEP